MAFPPKERHTSRKRQEQGCLVGRASAGAAAVRRQEQRRWVASASDGAAAVRGMAHRLAPAACLRQPSAHIRVLLAPYPRTTASFRRFRGMASFLGRLPCAPAIVSPLPALVERGLPRSTKIRFPGFALIEATTSTLAKDVVPWGSGASRPGMACARSSEPGTAEPSDAPDPQGTAAPSGASASAFRPACRNGENKQENAATRDQARRPGSFAGTRLARPG